MKNLVIALGLSALLVAPALAGGCIVTNTKKYTPSPPYIVVTKYLSMSARCTLTASVALAGAGPIASSTVDRVFAIANVSSALAQWNCTCGTILINQASGGLPVELLEIEVD